MQERVISVAIESKSAITFLNRAIQFNADLELIDIFCAAINNGELSGT